MPNLPLNQPFAFVFWLDAVTDNGWSGPEGDDTHVDLVWSAGWMLENSAKQVRLVADVGTKDASSNRPIAIPKRMVEEIRQDSRSGPILYQRRKRGKKAQSEVQVDQ